MPVQKRPMKLNVLWISFMQLSPTDVTWKVSYSDNFKLNTIQNRGEHSFKGGNEEYEDFISKIRRNSLPSDDRSYGESSSSF